MPTPKRKTSKARRDKRASTKFIRPQAVTACLNCSAALNPHSACTECGFYKGRKILTTKLDRVLKRGETRRAVQAKQEAAEPAHEHAEEK